MTDEEANKIIAEFMGWKEEEFVNDGFWGDSDRTPYTQYRLDNTIQYCIPCYTKSLDALVPVWEKLQTHEITLWNEHSVWGISAEVNKIVGMCNKDFGSEENSSIQEAAAHATAKATQEL